MTEYIKVFDILWRMVSRFMIQFGIVMKQASILLCVYYFYAVLGMETYAAIDPPLPDPFFDYYSKYIY